MKVLFDYPFAIYLVATIASLSIMVMVDYIIGAEAEHLNAWVIINRLLGNNIGIGDSLAIRHLGLAGATLLMLVLNTVFGAILIQLIKFTIRLAN